MDDIDIPFSLILRIFAYSLQNVILCFELPGGRPSFMPFDFFTAKASFVRCEMRHRSISAANAKAKAMISRNSS